MIQRLIQAHRLGGYGFIALFCLMSYFMALRARNLSDEPSMRGLVHVLLAMSLVPLLFVKVLIACYYKSYYSALTSVAHSSPANTSVSLEPRRFGMWRRPASSLNRQNCKGQALVEIAKSILASGLDRQPLPQLLVRPPVEHDNIHGADYYAGRAKPAQGVGGC
jgi:hypothetical protein